MKKIAILLLILFSITLYTQEQKQQIKEMYQEAYIYSKKSLLLSESELNCSFFISKKIDRDIKIIGAKEGWINREFYSDTMVMYINKGAKDGINAGDMFFVVEKGDRVPHPFKAGSLGTYYRKKSLAEVTCLYEDKAEITLKNGCNPVYIGDFLLKYKPEGPIFEQAINYKNCRLIKNEVSGRIVYFGKSHPMEKRTIVADAYTVSVDIGNALVKKGDFLLIYKKLNKKLPPLIIGTAIVLSAQKTNSTVKIIKVSNPVEIGDYVTLLPRSKKSVFEQKGEKLPEIGTKDVEIKLEPGDHVLDINVFFDLSSDKLNEATHAEIAKIQEFIKDKNQYGIILKGYTCNIGRIKHNLKLAQNRVQSVKKYLIETLKIPEANIESYYYGEKDCEFDNTTEINRKKNRRVAIKVIGK